MRIIRCGICERAMILYKPSMTKYKNSRRKLKLDQGPGINKNVKKWCKGHCEGTIADIDILVSVLVETGGKGRASWADNYKQDIERNLIKLIRGLARGHQSC